MANDDLQEKYQAFITNSSEGIWLCELDAPISVALPPKEQIRLMYQYAYMAECNDAMAKMYGLSSGDELKGVRLTELLIESDPKNTEYLLAFIRSGYRLTGAESHEKDVHGNPRIFRNSLVGVMEDGFVLRAWGTQHDITEQYLVHQALAQSQERLGLALAASRLGMWEWNLTTGELLWSDQLKELFGLAPTDSISYEKYQKLLHPQDRARMRKVIREAMKTGKEYEVEHRAVWADNSEHWVLGRGKAILENGKPVLMIGTSMSLDDSKRAAELEEINLKLKEQQEQLVELNQIKDDFIALASHQLRTPATAVKQYTNMLLDGYYGELSPGQRTAVSTALLSNERQLAIINDLLRVAQLDAGKIALHKKRVDVIELLGKVVEEQAAKFRVKNQKVTIKQSKPAMTAYIDPQRMRMVFENIIDNAHKYTPAAKSITVSVTQNKSSITISVRDQGVGIRKADLSRLFQKFSRLEHPSTTDVSGTGLGLYWANKIVLLHGGTITVTSASGKGTTFAITVPNT
ncbi:MAG TPA: ATP-binding protein [Candidatus Saccharimonadales bacterium]|nr:ATP-binding protein [Candidatus Saccharimonadales bacterium]